MTIAELAKDPSLLNDAQVLVVNSGQGGGGLNALYWLLYTHGLQGVVLWDPTIEGGMTPIRAWLTVASRDMC